MTVVVHCVVYQYLSCFCRISDLEIFTWWSIDMFFSSIYESDITVGRVTGNYLAEGDSCKGARSYRTQFSDGVFHRKWLPLRPLSAAGCRLPWEEPMLIVRHGRYLAPNLNRCNAGTVKAKSWFHLDVGCENFHGTWSKFSENRRWLLCYANGSMSIA